MVLIIEFGLFTAFALLALILLVIFAQNPWWGLAIVLAFGICAIFNAYALKAFLDIGNRAGIRAKIRLEAMPHIFSLKLPSRYALLFHPHGKYFFAIENELRIAIALVMLALNFVLNNYIPNRDAIVQIIATSVFSYLIANLYHPISLLGDKRSESQPESHHRQDLFWPSIAVANAVLYAVFAYNRMQSLQEPLETYLFIGLFSLVFPTLIILPLLRHEFLTHRYRSILAAGQLPIDSVLFVLEKEKIQALSQATEEEENLPKRLSSRQSVRDLMQLYLASGDNVFLIADDARKTYGTIDVFLFIYGLHLLSLRQA